MAVPIPDPVTIDSSEWNCLNVTDHPDDTGIDFPLLAAMADRLIVRLVIGLQEDRRARQVVEGIRPYVEAGELTLCFYAGVIEWLDPEEQAEFFYDLAQEVAAGLDVEFLMADFERDSSGLTQVQLANIYKVYLDELESLQGVAYETVIYTALWFWDPNIGAVYSEYFSQYRLMFAHYTLNFDYLLIPSSWLLHNKAFFLHQFSADGNNMGSTFGFPSRDLDMGRTNPDYLPPPIPPDPPPQGEVLFRVRCVQQVSNRDAPGTTGGWLRSIPVGEELDVVAIVQSGPRPTDAWLMFADETWAAYVYYAGTTVFFEVF